VETGYLIALVLAFVLIAGLALFALGRLFRQ
jgi:hypothetical protein